MGTLHRNNVQRLEDMWFTYQAIVLAGGTDGDVVWDFSTPVGFDKSSTAYVPLLRAGHLSSVISHFASCRKCQRLVALITDGKFGARRRVCANVEKFIPWNMLKISLQTGCDNTASSKVLYCKACRHEFSCLEQDQLGADLSSQVAVVGRRNVVQVMCLVFYTRLRKRTAVL